MGEELVVQVYEEDVQDEVEEIEALVDMLEDQDGDFDVVEEEPVVEEYEEEDSNDEEEDVDEALIEEDGDSEDEEEDEYEIEEYYEDDEDVEELFSFVEGDMALDKETLEEIARREENPAISLEGFEGSE